MSSSERPGLEALLQQQAHMARLAQVLLGDAAEADDVVQQVLLQALKRPDSFESRFEGSGRAWASRLIENAVRDRRRGEGRRARREADSARPESLPSTDDTVLAIERQRELLDAVMALDDPYRTVILLRYFEDLPPREIVERTGQSAEAVKKQLQRGLARLRASLEERFGGNGAWALALLPVATLEPVRVSAAVGSGALFKSLVIAGVLLSGGMIGVRALWPDGTSPDASSALPTTMIAVADAPERDPRGPDGVPEAPLARESAAPSGAAPSTPGITSSGSKEEAQEAATPRFSPAFRARVVDEFGAPLERGALEEIHLTFHYNDRGLRIYGGPEAVELPASESGWVESNLVPNQGSMGLGRIVATRGPLAVLAVGPASLGSTESRIVMMPGVAVAGRLLDAAGRPVAHMSVRVNADLAALGTYPGGMEATSAGRIPPTETDERGHFDLGRIPGHQRFTLEAGSTELGTVEVPVPLEDRLDLTLSLAPPALPDVVELGGRVIESNGAPVAGATVRLGWLEVRTEEDGSFRMDLSPTELAILEKDAHKLAAVAQDGRFVEAEVQSAGPFDVVLRLPASQSLARVRVLDSGGSAVSGATVVVYDGSPAGSSSRTLENPYSESAPRTDAEGCLTLTNLSSRSYTLRVIREDPFLVQDARISVPIGGEEALIRVSASHVVPRMDGRALDLRGEPLPGIQVQLLAYHAPAGRVRSQSLGPATMTDTEGRFTLANVPRFGVTLAFDAQPNDSRSGSEVDVESLRLPGPFDQVLDLECELHPTLREGFIAAKLRFYDATGDPVRVTRVVPGGTRTAEAAEQNGDGTFGRLLLSQRALRVDVLDASGGRLRTVPLVLSPVAIARPEL